MTLRLLLLQARDPNDPMSDHEHECFVTRTRLERTQIVPHNLLESTPSIDDVRRYDAVLMGGSGDYLVTKGNQPRFEPFLELLREIVQLRHPTFAACYGYQSMVHAMGGDVVYDPDNLELGTYELTLSDHGVTDPVFSSLPKRFMAQQGHKDRAVRLPEGFVNLASTETCELQALRYRDAPIWAVQFHPELDRDGNRARYRHYLQSYSPDLTPEEV